jgi:hypothetical protein
MSTFCVFDSLVLTLRFLFQARLSYGRLLLCKHGYERSGVYHLWLAGARP